MPIEAVNEIPAAKEALAQRAQQVWTMLDEMAANNPETYQKFINKQMKEASQSMADRNPSAELCLRTWLYHENCFLFVEIFSWILISAPRVLENQTQELPAHITDVEFQTNFKENKKSARLMLVVNPEVVEKLKPTIGNKQPSLEQRYLVQNILELIEGQNGLSLKTDSFDVFDKSVCTGDPIKLRKKIFNASKQKNPNSTRKKKEETDSVLERLTNINLSDNSDDDEKDDKSLSSLLKVANKKADSFCKQETKQEAKGVLIHEISKNHAIEPRHEILRSKDEKWLTVNVQLPGVKSGTECEVDLIEDVLTVDVDSRYNLLLPLDAKIDETMVTAEFSSKSALLTVQVPIITNK